MIKLIHVYIRFRTSGEVYIKKCLIINRIASVSTMETFKVSSFTKKKKILHLFSHSFNFLDFKI